MIVVEFEGVRHFNKPGWQFRPDKVRVDFGDWRPAKSQDGKKIADWMIERGYRMLNVAGRSHSGSLYREWWGLEGVFPAETNEHGLVKRMPPEVIRETFQAFRAQVEAAAAA
jgi:hypothetical protein